MYLGVNVSFMSLIRTGMSLASQSCCRRKHDSAKPHASASLRMHQRIQTDFSLPALGTEPHGGTMPGSPDQIYISFRVSRIAAMRLAQMPSGDGRNCFAMA